MRGVRQVGRAHCCALTPPPHIEGKEQMRRSRLQAKGARDKTSGKRVTTFKVSNRLYAYNDGKAPRHSGERDLDRDNDGIACEKR